MKRREHTNTFRLGLFVITATALFIVAIYLIGNERNLFQSTFRLYAVFEQAEGLKPGNNVRYAGIDAGMVKHISFISDSTLKVEMVLQKQMKTIIRKDAVAAIGSDGLVGNKLINISPGRGNAAAPLVADCDLISSSGKVATDDLLEVFSKTNENIALASVQLLQIAEKINSGKGVMNMLLEDAALAGDLRQSVSYLKFTAGSLHSIGRQMEQTLKQAEQGEGLLHDLLYDTTVMAELRTLEKKINGMVDRQVAPLVLDLQQAGGQLAESSAALQEIMQQVRTGQGSLGALLYDADTERDIKASMSHIRQSAERLNENMEAMRHHFLFRRYFKKMEKE